MRFAYADPPYIGKAYRYNHVDAARWNDPAEHIQLMQQMADEYDGWAMSAKATSLKMLLPASPAGTRVAVWVKPFAAIRANQRIAYRWEPVLFNRITGQREGEPLCRDYLAEPISTRRGTVGAKPERFCSWVLDLLGWMPGDSVADLFPGSGVMTRIASERLL